MDDTTRYYRDALRLLFILARAGDQIAGSPPVVDAVTVVDSQKKFQKMDFWVRNPDHFAYALLEAHREQGHALLLDNAKSILDSAEPEIRRDAMLKYLYGAYEPMDTALAPLFSYGMAQMMRDKSTKQRMYFLLQKGLETADRILLEVPEAQWYSERAALVGEFCKGRTGEELARWQYRHPTYAGAKNGETIASIAKEVRQRIAELETAGG